MTLREIDKEWQLYIDDMEDDYIVVQLTKMPIDTDDGAIQEEHQQRIVFRLYPNIELKRKIFGADTFTETIEYEDDEHETRIEIGRDRNLYTIDIDTHDTRIILPVLESVYNEIKHFLNQHSSH